MMFSNQGTCGNALISRATESRRASTAKPNEVRSRQSNVLKSWCLMSHSGRAATTTTNTAAGIISSSDIAPARSSGVGGIRTRGEFAAGSRADGYGARLLFRVRVSRQSPQTARELLPRDRQYCMEKLGQKLSSQGNSQSESDGNLITSVSLSSGSEACCSGVERMTLAGSPQKPKYGRHCHPSLPPC